MHGRSADAAPDFDATTRSAVLGVQLTVGGFGSQGHVYLVPVSTMVTMTGGLIRVTLKTQASKLHGPGNTLLTSSRKNVAIA